jgi:hypothetical protein
MYHKNTSANEAQCGSLLILISGKAQNVFKYTILKGLKWRSDIPIMKCQLGAKYTSLVYLCQADRSNPAVCFSLFFFFFFLTGSCAFVLRGL